MHKRICQFYETMVDQILDSGEESKPVFMDYTNKIEVKSELQQHYATNKENTRPY